MFDNIGGKIKVLAQVICGIGMAISVLYGFILMLSGIGAYYGGGQKVLVGILVIVLGSLSSWIGSFFTYGFGELIENTEEIRRNTYVPKTPTNVSTYQKQASGNSDQKLKTIITGKSAQASRLCPHCGATVNSSPCEMCGKEF